MEITSLNPPERDSNESCCSSSNANDGPPLHPIRTPTPNPRSNETNPNPTTFVQADTATFKQVVQMLTGSSAAAKQPPKPGGGIPPIKSTGQKKQGFKLYERRNSLKNGLLIDTPGSGFSRGSNFSPRKPELLSPSILDFPSLALSPVTPANEDTLGKPSAAVEEDLAIAEKKFYFHPSPRTAARGGEPQLLSLFPVTSPRVSGSY
ncbi:hypothetical protein CASFOL_024413 [Castilleja foliolosa]|uniref:VQ domain-containing protein n=1 Tax=Castilleja foliolosa TaxID=1961234 RepID=A0ABD3CQK4_9LAMI